jgi:hypothetical protein
MKKIAAFIILGLFIAVLGTLSFSYAADDTGVTNLQFAQFLTQQLNITLPEGSDKLPQDQYYKAMADALAGKGVTYFQESALANIVTNGTMGDVLYQVAGGKDTLDSAGKLNYLVSNGFLTEAPADPNANVTMESLTGTFSSPNLTKVIAETFTNPLNLQSTGKPGSSAPLNSPETQNPSPI